MTPNYHQTLTLARSGSPVRAWAVFEQQGLGAITDDPKVLTLKGRLQKDLADRADGDERQQLYRDASASYLAAYELKSDSYPLINAATLALLAGDIAQSQALAGQVLDLIDSDPDEGETPYWREATAAEALLLLDQRRQAKDRLARGVEKLPQAWEDHAATIGQFERIAALRDESADWLDAFRPPCSVHFSGLIGLYPDDRALQSSIQQTVARLKPGFAFGALAAGADIMLAEALVDAGAELHITLPCPIEDFRAISVEAFGSDWGARFDKLHDRCETLNALPAENDDTCGETTQVELASLVSMGQAIRQAEVFRSASCAVTIAASGETLRSSLQQWQRTGAPITVIETQRVSGSAASSEDRLGVGRSDDADGLITIAAVSGGDAESLAAIAGKHQLELNQTGAMVTISGEPQSVMEALGTVGSNTKAALQFCANATLGNAKISTELLLAASTTGTVVSDWATAMVCKVIDPDTRIEELGEVNLTSGRTALWSIGIPTDRG